MQVDFVLTLYRAHLCSNVKHKIMDIYIAIIGAAGLIALVATTIYLRFVKKPIGSTEMLIGAFLQVLTLLRWVLGQYIYGSPDIYNRNSDIYLLDQILIYGTPIGVAIFTFGFMRFTGFMNVIRGRSGV